MMTTRSGNAVEDAFAAPLTQELLGCSGIAPGMRVLVLGAQLAALAPLVAERVGCHGSVVAAHQDPHAVDEARQRAADEGFERVSFSIASVERLELDQPVDAVVGRFFLMYERDPVAAMRCIAGLVRDGGRVVMQEWHYASTLWVHTSAWPRQPLYQKFARWSIEGLRQRRAHADIGLRLVNVFAEAGLPPPLVRTDLRVIRGGDSFGYAFFEAALARLRPALKAGGFAARLERETIAGGGHVFLPLQVGVFARVATNL